MIWGLFVPQFPKDHVVALHAMRQGLEKLNIPHFQTAMEYRDCDVAVVFGIGKKAVPASFPRGAIIDAHRARSKPVLILEKGFIKRDEYFHIGWNGLNGHADFRNKAMSPGRWSELGISMKNWQADDAGTKSIVICGQVPWDASVQHSDHLVWCQDTVAMLRAMTARKLVFRPHPAVAGRIQYPVTGVEVSSQLLDYDLDRAHAVVTYNSNTAVDAVIRGVPVFVEDEGTMAGAVANWDLSDIERPKKPPRQQWASNLAYTQWTLEEIAAGDPIVHLTSEEKDHGRAERRVP